MKITKAALGIDIGSTTTKIVLLEDSKKVYENYQRHMSRVRQTTLSMLRDMQKTHPVTEVSVTISGSAGMGLAEAAGLDFIQEVYATGEVVKRGLSEVRRVLKTGGAFYCATFGEHGIIEYLSKTLGAYGVEDNVNKNFTLQNGKEILAPFFTDVQKLNYEDSLAVTEIDDLVEYIYSLSSMTTLSAVPKEEIHEVLAKHMINGVLQVPKEYGMFCCRK